MHSEVVVLGIDELACRSGLPHPVLHIAQQLLSAVSVNSRKHDVCLGAAICNSISFRLHDFGSSICTLPQAMSEVLQGMVLRICAAQVLACHSTARPYQGQAATHHKPVSVQLKNPVQVQAVS